MEKYCQKCGNVFDDLNFKLCPYCGSELATRYGRQPIPRKLRHEVFKRDGYRCRECGASKDETSLEIDHIVPVAKGGTNDIDNLQTLCRECNRMKHTDEWVGGETDFETAKSKLDSLKNQIKNTKVRLKQAKLEDDIIEYEYQIMMLEKMLPDVENKYNKLYNENKQFEAKRKSEEKKKKLYKKLYVKIDEKAFLRWSNDNALPFSTKEEFINYACNCSEDDVNNFIYTCTLYKELLNNSQMLISYNSLYDEIDDESLELLKELSSLNFTKGLLILESINTYGAEKIKDMIKNRKEEIEKENERIKEEERKKKYLQNKTKIFKIKQKAILKEYNEHITLSEAAEIAGYDAKVVCLWYYEGKCGYPVYEEFYNEINKIKEPTSSIDLEHMPSTKKWYCITCGKWIPSKYSICSHCNAKKPSKYHQTKSTYSKCQKCGKLIWNVLSKCPHCGSTDIKEEPSISSFSFTK